MSLLSFSRRGGTEGDGVVAELRATLLGQEGKKIFGVGGERGKTARLCRQVSAQAKLTLRSS
jgi:hypothetical protein